MASDIGGVWVPTPYDAVAPLGEIDVFFRGGGHFPGPPARFFGLLPGPRPRPDGARPRPRSLAPRPPAVGPNVRPLAAPGPAPRFPRGKLPLSRPVGTVFFTWGNDS